LEDEEMLLGRLLDKTPGQHRSGLAACMERVGRTGDLPKLTVRQAFWFVADLMIQAVEFISKYRKLEFKRFEEGLYLEGMNGGRRQCCQERSNCHSAYLRSGGKRGHYQISGISGLEQT
jgi:hypothetical protein